MNFGIVTSYYVAGILILAILTMNMSLSRSSSELTLSQMAGEHVATISEIITYDIPKIGYDRVTSIPDPIIRADSNEIEFEANIDNTGDVEQVLWKFTNTSVGSSENPNDYVLLRRVKSKSTGTVVTKTDITLGVTHFEIHYYDEYGADRGNSMPTPISPGDLDKIRQIEINLVVESAEKLSGFWSSGSDYVRSAWEKRFSPVNLQSD